MPPEPISPDQADPVDLSTLRKVARALTGDSNSRSVLRTLCDAAMLQGSAHGASVAQVSGDSGTFVAGSGIGAKLVGVAFPLTGSITARVISEQQGIAMDSAIQSTSPFIQDLLSPLGVGPVLVLPLLAQGELLGVLSIFRKEWGELFDSHDQDRLGTIADLAALALWKVRSVEEAQSADSAKTSLLATLSHELRTPLAALEGYGELLEDEILGPLAPQQRDVIVRLRTVGRHLGALIEDILTYASLEADRVVPRDGPVRVEELLDSLHPYVEPLAREKNIEFRIDVESGLPVLQTDDARVRQILLNLCQNGVKFTERGSVDLRVSRGSPGADGVATVRFAVRDTGIGIETSHLQRLFRPFSQLEDVSARRHRGTGLGLYISRRLATILGGRIEVVSRPGEGSVFTLVLPVVRRPLDSTS
ncbi:MAG: HAMP domain-containing sensor histidine kinase [Gemmatimonadota bacterium]